MSFHDDLKNKIHRYVKLVYKVTKNFPKDELYGLTSQYRRSSMSVMLNYIEGYARQRGGKCKVYANFMEVAYGSLKESKYITYFSYTENYVIESDYKELILLADDIGAMLWGTISKQRAE